MIAVMTFFVVPSIMFLIYWTWSLGCFPGWMTAKEAKKNGFTHHGSYYGIPLWLTDSDEPTIATKWAPMEFVFDVFMFFEQMIAPVEQQGFAIMIGPEIE